LSAAPATDHSSASRASEADQRLVLVSNRGPVTFESDGSVRRGTGGLVTALTGLASHREVTWIASAMTDEDVAVAESHDGRPFPVKAPDGGAKYLVKLVASDADAYDRFYNIIANPMLWFVQHYLWDLSNAPDIRRNETEAFEFGYNAVNEDLAEAVLEEIDGVARPVVMVHDYHLYTLPGLIRRARPDAFLHHFVHIPWSQSDSWRVLPSQMRDQLYHGILANDIVGFHTRSYRRNFLQCCEDLLDDVEVDREAGIVRVAGREVWVRNYPLPIDAGAVQAVAARPRVREFETELLRRRRDHLILRVDRADLSKNVLRGFSAFDVFLEQHPEFREKVTFIAQLMPSRTDVPEYAEYLERIEAVVAVVNHRHGSPDWMPIQLKLRDDLEEAVAAYKHYDVLMVNAMFDGMNLVAKEGPMVNERAGVSILSENTGAHEELGEYALSVNPFDLQELADSIHAALTMEPAERRRRLEGLRRVVTARDPGDWVDEQLADVAAKAERGRVRA
jgi:trehalose 6-phosphate synthase